MDNKVLNKINQVSEKVSRNHFLQGISQGIMSILPMIIIGAFASLFLGLPIDAWKNFIHNSGVSTALNAVVNATTNLLGIYITYGVAKSFADQKKIEGKIIGLLAILVYFILLPGKNLTDGTAYLSFDFLGTKGMIIGMIISICTVSLYKFILDRNIRIKMPEGTPDFVSNSFTSLIPGFLITLMAIIVKMVFTLTPFKDPFECVYQLLQAPLTAIVGGNIISIVVLTSIAQIIFAFGIHSGFVTSMLAPILFSLDAMNQAAYAAGDPLPNIIGMAFVYTMTTAVFYPAMSLSTLIAAKSERIKTVGKIALFPSIFGISEPLLFGLPIIFNFTLIIPYVVIPALNLIIGYTFMSLGIVSACSGVTVFNIPMIATGIMNGSISLVILEIGLLVLDILLFMPFIKIVDKNVLKEEIEKKVVE